MRGFWGIKREIRRRFRAVVEKVPVPFFIPMSLSEQLAANAQAHKPFEPGPPASGKDAVDSSGAASGATGSTTKNGKRDGLCGLI